MITGVTSATEGDSQEIGGTRIHLHEVDAPKARQFCPHSTGQPWRCSQQAALALPDRVGQRSVSFSTILTELSLIAPV